VSKIPLSKGQYQSSFTAEQESFLVDTNRKALNQIAPGVGFKATSTTGASLLGNFRAELKNNYTNYVADLRLDYAF